jgi:DNA-binding beta-propeller fold protein YncE
VRPGVIGPTPTTIPQNTAGVLSFNVDGGFFGTGSNPAAPAVNATFNGQLRGVQLPPSQTIGSTRQLSVTIGGGSNTSDFAVPGLYPVAIRSNSDSTKFAVANLAVQPANPAPTPLPSTPIAVGSIPGTSAPSDVAVNPATGVAVVANFGSNDVSLIQLPANPQTDPATLIANICTASVGATSSGCAPSGPTSVAVDYVRNIALVVNQTAKTIAVVDLKSKSISAVLSPLTDTPEAVGINPITGRALVAMQQRNYGVLVDVTGTPAYAGIVSISTGSNTKVAVEPHLNWAIATPGTLGSLGIVDLSKQSVNAITAISRTNNGSTDVVTVTVQSGGNAPPLAVVAGDAVFIQNVNFPAGTDPTIAAQAASLNGFFTVSSVGPGSNQFSYTQTGTPLPDVATQSAPQNTSSGTVNYAQRHGQFDHGVCTGL